jgi:hypothetical protein
MPNRPQDQQPSRRPEKPDPADKGAPDANERSGSTGRQPGTGDARQDGENTGQDRYGMTGGADRNAPEPGHEAGSSGTSDYGRSDYGEPGDHERESNEGSGRADRAAGETQGTQSQSQKSSGAALPPRVPSKQRKQ